MGCPLIGLNPDWATPRVGYLIAIASQLMQCLHVCACATVQQQAQTAFPCITQQSRMLQFSAKTNSGMREWCVETVPTAVHWPMLMSQYLRAWKNLLTNSESVPSIILNSFFVPASTCYIKQSCSHTAHVVCKPSKRPACRWCLTSACNSYANLCKDSRQ